MTFKQSPRLPADGSVAVRRAGEQHLAIDVVNNGSPETILLSEFNASRALGMLALMLGVKLDKADAKAIKL